MKEAQLCTFTVGHLLCGVGVLEVQEVLRERELTPVPLAPPGVRGLMNLRGDVVAAIDLRTVLGLPQRRLEEAAQHVIIRTPDEWVSLMVDTVEDVLSLSRDTYEEPPQTVGGAAREYITGVHKLDTRLLLVLDAQRIAVPAGER